MLKSKYLIPRLHEEAYMKHTWSILIQYTRARSVLQVCFKFALRLL